MKSKKVLFPLLSVAAIITACRGEGGGGGGSQSIKVDPLSASEVGISEQYLPSKKDIRQLSGEITIALDFEGRDAGWKEVAKEYERLQGGAVKINVKADVAGDQYGSTLNQMLQDVQNGATSEWDIVEGNLGYGNTRKTCVDIHTMIKDPNPYCGADNTSWNSVLTEQAYYNYDSDRSWGKHYILNTENMQSCWFVNDVALEAAKTAKFVSIETEQANPGVNKDLLDKTDGYKNAKGQASYPITWNDLINLCRAMQAAGYSNPLGITLSTSSLKSLQFTWLLRIYGDYYYRQFYKYTMNTADKTWPYDPTESCPERNDGFGFKQCRVLNLLFDESTTYGPGYVGYKSEVYLDFVNQLCKMKGLFIQDPTSTEFSDVRSQFMMQSKQKASAQIVLDYLGQGLQYEKYENDGFKLGYFDYPQMISGTYQKESQYVTGANAHSIGDKIVDDRTLTRDIGGNGGFVSIVDQLNKPNRTVIAKDFIKFFLSPYGQSIYYKGLSETENHISPKGLTTVKTGLVNIPREWKTFFEDAEDAGVEFNGNVDPDVFISYGVRYFQGYPKSETKILNWQQLLVLNKKYDAEAFANDWNEACFSDYQTMCRDAEHGWPVEMYLDPNGNI